MGKKRIAILGEEEKTKKEHKKSLKEEKGVRVPGLKGGERVVAVTAEPVIAETQKEAEAQKETKIKRVRPPKIRSKNYLAAKTKIDPTKLYPINEAIKLLKETSYGRFDGTAEIHLVTGKTGIQGDVSLPYFQGKTASLSFKTEPNAPLVHFVFGKVSQKEPELEENLKIFLAAVGTKNIKRAVIKGTMGPGIKIAVDNL